MINTFKYVCYGEVLWDVFPDYQVIGGAPLNVALRLNALDGQTAIISAVGNDGLGLKLVEFLKQNNLPIQYIQTRGRYETGSVKVTLDKEGSASYDIEFPKAWDFIKINPEIVELVTKADVFIFGSLVARHEVSHKTLLQLLKSAKFKVFDMNLRAPHYNFALLTTFLDVADFLKMNDEELKMLCEHQKIPDTDMRQQLLAVSKTHNIKHICVTRGKDGALLLTNNQFFEHPGYSIIVKDTVGAGDSFLASLIYKFTNDGDPQSSLNFACAVGALVAEREGANLNLTAQEIEKFISL